MQKVEKNIPYSLSVDYNELFERLESGEMIVGFYNRIFEPVGLSNYDKHAYEKHVKAGDYTQREICQLEMRKGVITGGVRGLSCLNLTDFDLDLYNKNSNLPPVTLKELFVKDCKGINLGWIKPQ